jgi:NADPH-dependent 7-cyano-7-deazaguanine reductase QueF
VAKIAPRSVEVTGDFMVRGGIHTIVRVSHP